MEQTKNSKETLNFGLSKKRKLKRQQLINFTDQCAKLHQCAKFHEKYYVQLEKIKKCFSGENRLFRPFLESYKKSKISLIDK